MENVTKEKYKGITIEFRKNPNVPNVVTGTILANINFLKNPVVAKTKADAFKKAKKVILDEFPRLKK